MFLIYNLSRAQKIKIHQIFQKFSMQIYKLNEYKNHKCNINI
jgi:hypothetical protein